MVSRWMRRGMTILNGRRPYDDGKPTRRGSSQVLDYVMTTRPRSVDRMENVEMAPELSDHHLLIVRRKHRGEKTVPQTTRDAGQAEVELGSVRWRQWGEVDVATYNDRLIEEWEREMEERAGRNGDEGENDKTDRAQGEADEIERAMTAVVARAAVQTETERLGRMRQEGEAGDPFFAKVSEVKKTYEKARSEWNRNPTSETRSRYTETKKEWRKEWQRVTRKMKRSRTRSWRNMSIEPEKLWRELDWVEKGGRRRRPRWVVKRPDGTLTQTEEEALDVTSRWCRRVSLVDWGEECGAEFDERKAELMFWIQEWRGVVTEARWERKMEAGEEAGELAEICSADLLRGELRLGEKRGGAQKAAGSDELPNEAVLLMEEKNKAWLRDGWRQIWAAGRWPQRWKDRVVTYLDKKAQTCDLDGKRGISLLQCMGKKFGQSVTARLRTILNATVSRVQGAARRRGCLRQAGAVTQIIGSRMRRGKRTMGVLIDLKKAFDTVDHRAMRAALRRRGVHGRLLQMVWRKYEGRRARVRVRGENKTMEGEWWADRGRGVTQGGVDSLELFNVMIDDLEEALIEAGVRGVDAEEGGERWRMVAYADDVILLAESDEDAQKAVQVTEDFYKRWRLVPNPDKCEVVVWDGQRRTAPKIVMRGVELAVRRSVLYLGFLLQDDGKWGGHVERRRKKAAKWRWKVKSVARARGAAPTEIAERVCRGGELASAHYGGEIWAETEGPGYEKMLNAQMRKDRRVLGLPDRTPGAWVREEQGDREWAEELFLRKAELLKKMACGEEDVAGQVARERTAEWRKREEERRDRGEVKVANTTTEPYDWIGRCLDELRGMTSDADGKGIVDAMADDGVVWRDVERGVTKMVKTFFDERQRRRMEEVTRGRRREYEGKKRWTAEWLRARGGLTTAELCWIEAARTGVLEVEEEMGRRDGRSWGGRICGGCGSAVGTAAHMLDRCVKTEEARRETLRKMEQLGAKGVTLWQAVSDPSSMGRCTESRARELIREVNRAVSRMMRTKRSRECGDAGEDSEGESEDETETAGQRKRSDGGRPRGCRAGARKRKEGGDERCFVTQSVNVAELRKLIDTTMDDKTRRTAQACVGAQRDGRLRVEYRRNRGGGRWYAIGMAQLQSCPVTVRTAALKGAGWEADLRAAFPTIVLALVEEMAGRQGHERDDRWPALRRYVTRTGEVRERVAQEFGVGVTQVKKCFNRLIFGGSIDGWKRATGVETRKESREVREFARELAKARVLIAEAERRRDNETTGTDRAVLSRVVEREEERVMRQMRDRLEAKGWKVTALIHDAIILGTRRMPDERNVLTRDIREATAECHVSGLAFRVTKT